MASLKEQSEKLFNMGLQYSENRQFDNAIKYYTKVINLTIDKRLTYPFSWKDLKESLEKKRKACEKELELNPNLVMAYFNRGKCNQELKDYDSAVLDYKEVIELTYDSEEFKLIAMAYVARGKCQQELKEYFSALLDYEKVIKLANNNEEIKLHLDFFDIYYNLGICYEEDNKQSNEEYMSPSFAYELYGYRESYREPWELQELDRRDRAEHHNRCCERLERALEAYSKAIELKPSFADAYNHRGNCYIELDVWKYNRLHQENELALADYNKAIELNPCCIEYYDNRGNYYKDFGKNDLALADYDEIIKLDNDNIKVYIDRVLCNALKNREKQKSAHNSDVELWLLNRSLKKSYDEAINALTSLSKRNAEELDKKNQALDEKNKQLELAKQEIAEKNKELNNLIAMFAHNFLGTLQCIRSNAEHDNNPKIHLKTVKMMSGALTAFSIISADDDKLIEQLKQDNKGDTTLLQNLANNLALAVSQLLSKTNKDKIINLYLHYLRKTNQIAAETDGEELGENKEYRKKWQALQHQWEDEFNALFSENVDFPQLQNWLETNFFPLQIEGFNECNIRFKEYGITDSIFLVVFMEILVNALKYMDVSQHQPLTITLCKQDQHYQLTCENPSAQETYRGTHKGMDFLKSIAKKINGQFITESTAQRFKSTFIIPAELLE